MSSVSIAGTLILKGDLACTGTVSLTSTGLIVPVVNELTDYIFSCPIKDLVSQNGKTPTITSYSTDLSPLGGAIRISGNINSNGQGFSANFGPGANSTLYAVNTEIVASIYGATHGGLGFVSDIPGSIQVVEEQFTVNALQHDQEFIVLQYDPIDDIVALNIIGGTSQKQGIDFLCTDGIVSWEGYALEPLIEISDIIRILYLADTSRIYPSPRNTYGSYEAPTSVGSGSGEAAGGCGIKLYAPDGLVFIGPSSDTTVCANGEDGFSSRSGGGSGGSIWIKAFDTTVFGTITADGGNASYDYAGGGGGGYVTLNYEHNCYLSGNLSAKKGKGANNGIVYVEPIEPILIDKFTGTVLNTKWWELIDRTGPSGTLIYLNNSAYIVAYNSDPEPSVRSLFSLSGKNFKTDIDFNPMEYANGWSQTYFRLFVDSSNWVAVERDYPSPPGNVYGAYSLNGVVTRDSTTAYPFVNTTFRIIKTDSTFSFQFLDSSTGFQELTSSVIPEFSNEKFKVSFGMEHLTTGETNSYVSFWDNFKIYEGIVHDAESPESILYVDPTHGSDSSDGGVLTPLKNLFVAADWAKKDSIIVLYNGTHNPTEIRGKSLSIIGANGASPTITTANVLDSTGSNWENSCLTFRDCQGQVKNVRLVHAQDAVFAENTKNLEISGCEITDATTGIRFTEYTINPKVLRNTIHGVEEGVVIDSQVYNSDVYSNLFYDMTTGVRVVDASNYVIAANTFDGIINGVVVDQTSRGSVLSNNLTNLTVGVQVDNDSSVSIFNNNFYNTTPYSGSGVVLDFTNNISLYPYYYNASVRNYRLLSSSPDRSSGSDRYEKYYIDRDGARRQMSPGYDIGAYSYISAAHIPGNYYVDSSGDDYLNTGNSWSPYRTLDKALSVADSSIGVNSGHYDSFHLGLRNQSIFLVDTTNHAITLDSHYSNINLGNTLFVSPSGSDGTIMGGDGTDSGGNGSLQKPFRTINRALQVAAVGANIVCLSGDYPVFTGKQNRTIVPLGDRTGMTDGRMFIQDLFNTPSTLYPNHVYPDTSNWSFDITALSEINLHDGYLALTYDKIHDAVATSTFAFRPDFEITAELRQAFDPIYFSAFNGDNTVMLEYYKGDYTSNLYSGGEHYYCWGHLNGDTTNKYFTDYVCVSSQDVQNRFISLTYMIQDSSDVAVNLIGGPSQECGIDYYIRDNLVKWDGKELDGEIKAGDIMRVIYTARGLSGPARVQFVVQDGILTVRGTEGSRFDRLMKRAIKSDYTTNPWSVMFYMDKTGGDETSFGRGYVSKFSVIASAFDGTTEAQPYEYKTWRQSITLY